MTDFTIPGDCIDRVTARNGDRVVFERLATPKPTPKVTLKRNWQSQQQQQQQPQHPISLTQTYQISGTESNMGKQNARRLETHRRSGLATKKLEHTTSDMNMETHFSDKEVSTDALVENEAVKEELTDTNTKAIERIKIGSK